MSPSCLKPQEETGTCSRFLPVPRGQGRGQGRFLDDFWRCLAISGDAISGDFWRFLAVRSRASWTTGGRKMAGIQHQPDAAWMPAFAGMTDEDP
jgi:hypothetical protein